MLGQLGRNVRSRHIITDANRRDAFKWRAFADLVQYGPLIATTPTVVEAAWEGISEGNLIKAVTGALTSGYTEAAKNVALQSAVSQVRAEDEKFAIAILGALTGSNAQEILQEQRNIALLEFAGEARNLLFSPGATIAGIGRIFTNQIEAIKQAPILEKILRIGTLFVAPPAIGIAGIATAAALFNPAGLLVALTVGIVGLAAAVVVPTAVMTFMNAFPFSKTMEKVKLAQARNLVRTPETKNALRLQREEFVKALEGSAMLVPPLDVEEKPTVDKALWEACSKPLEELKDKMIQDLKNWQVQFAGTPDREMTIGDVREKFVSVANPIAIRERATQMIEKSISEDNLSTYSKDDLIILAMQEISEQLKKGWFIPLLDEVYKNEFCVMVALYDSPEQYLAVKKEQGTYDTLDIYKTSRHDKIESNQGELDKKIEGVLNGIPHELSGERKKIKKSVTTKFKNK